ncbi:MAG: cryptochrome/photolyase family protein [Rhizobiaceae bacterium]|jgi:deoxyribodipyrimidine photolyase-related protein|nr:cryptochrome/photolyase family protein [Rhizobiaceae bacterium]
MTALRLILGDQLTRSISALNGVEPGDIVLMAEVRDEATYVGHHKQKIALIFAAMRHFGEELRREGIEVDYVRLDDPANAGSFTGELQRAVARHRPDAIIATEPGEWRVLEMMQAWQDMLGLPVHIRVDDRFIASRDRFSRWAGDRKQLRMEFFYREMRRETGILMEGGEPVGGAWNFDAENRKSLPKTHRLPARKRFAPDDITGEVIALVEARFPAHFGTLDGFGWPVTREQALEALDDFMRVGLPFFGDYQDAMKTGEAFLHHSLISPALNIGLLTPLEACRRAEAEFHAGRAPLNAVEGFIRQILGWREYVRGLYWHLMPGYAEKNALDARRPLPDFYWTADTPMRCVSEVVKQTRDNAYSHHIQRLMVTGNFALLAGLDPVAVNDWYLAVYADAFEWVELPNTHGMALYADGGIMASKPYAASGAYIDRMSDFCSHCAYDVKAKSGDKACPFNRLYWAFLIRNETRLKTNPRMAMPMKTLARMDEAERQRRVADAERFLDGL